MTSPLALKPLGASAPLRDQISQALRAAILEVDIYAPGVDLRLDERALAEQLGISRTPVREALTRLAEQGLVTILPRRGVFIVKKSLPEILETVIAWAALESMAARLAADRASEADLADLATLAGDGETEDLARYTELNFRFHRRILALSGTTLLPAMADDLFPHMVALRRRAMGEADRIARSVIDHQGIVAALTARDPDRAEARVRAHTMALHDHIRASWGETATAAE